MKKYYLLFLVIYSVSLNAQVLKDNFDTNSLGWTEISGAEGEAVIKEGIMHIESKKSGNSFSSILLGVRQAPSFVETHCYGGFDVNKDFEIKCKAFAKKIDDDNVFGIMLDYFDDGNYILFTVTEKRAILLRVKEYAVIGGIKNDLKLKSQKKASLNLSIKSSFQKLQFYVNDMLAIEARYLPMTSSGIGLYVYGKQTVDFDDLEIIQ